MVKRKVLDAFDRTRCALSFDGTTSRTKQSFRDECDANSIMAKWHKSGQIDHINQHTPVYGDFETVDDYLAATLKVQAAELEFGKLSAAVRDRMGNSPANFIRFMHDEENHDEAVALGLISQPATPPVVKAPADATPEPPPKPPEKPAASPVAGGE